MIYDGEMENHESFKRFANFSDPRNWVIYRGWKVQGDKQCSMSYHPKPDNKFLSIPKSVDTLVGFNFKFDLLFEWKSPGLKEFFKRGGKIWCCQYAEYLLNAQHENSRMCSLDSIVEKYGGRKKIDEVKILWDSGKLTSQIDKDLITDYLIGTQKEHRDSGDIGNTEKIYLGQIKRAEELGMMVMIQARMDGLLCTTEMEFNGLHIDIQEAKRRMKILQRELTECDAELQKYIPELPEELEFNWGSPNHRSALIFGGAVKYDKQSTYIDSKTNQLARYKDFDKVEDGVYTSGKKKGSIKYKTIEAIGGLKTRNTEFTFTFVGYTVPDAAWAGKNTDANGKPVYSTGADIIEELGSRDIPFLKTLAKRQDIQKDLGTYYLQYDAKHKEYTGMITCINPKDCIVHHNLNHTITVTTRLSSDRPNLQNIPKEGTSEVKKMFTSRFKDGKILELDYSQLEVVVQGVLSKDRNLLQDLRDKIDFHCKRVMAKYKISYDEAVSRCKDEHNPLYPEWKRIRSSIKEFSFQRAYGAGAKAISDSTGMSIEDVEALIKSEDALYPGVAKFNTEVERHVHGSAKPFRQYFPNGSFKVYRRGYYKAPSGTRYSFRTYDAKFKWQRDKGITDSFNPTELKNYPVQGMSGEIVQIILGKLYRHFLNNNNYSGDALLCNTVHDCVWIDVNDRIAPRVAKEIKQIMESVPEVLEQLYGMKVTVPFPVSAEIGENLFTQEKIN